jgi:hypothetical protein
MSPRRTFSLVINLEKGPSKNSWALRPSLPFWVTVMNMRTVMPTKRMTKTISPMP